MSFLRRIKDGAVVPVQGESLLSWQNVIAVAGILLVAAVIAMAAKGN